MKQFWTSADGYVRVVDELWFPAEGEGGEADLAALFRAGAWIAIWRAEGQQHWRVSRNRRMPKPSLKHLSAIIRAWDNPLANSFWATADGSAGHIMSDNPCDPVELAQALYSAWETTTLRDMPRKIAHLGLDPDAPDKTKLPAWMRPGVALYVERRTARGILAEIYAEEEE